MTTSSHYDSIFRPGLFQGQIHVVTGGGSGIGRCVAHELAALGATVVITGRTQEKLDKVAAEIREDGGQVDTAAFDIRDEEQVKAAVARIVTTHGRIHGLVNNAGGQFPAPMEMISKRGFEAVVANNLTGGFLMAREVFNQSLSKHGGGAIVNMAADMWNGMAGMAHSGAARAGMVNLTKTAAFEWARSHVRVNAVAPGWVASSGMDSYGPAMAPMILSLKDNLPMRRLGLEAEISSVICFLLSPGAAFVTGVTVAIDGGAGVNNPVWPKAPHEPAPSFNGFHRATTPKVLQGL
ncbi:MAG: 2,4-dienoyl-CoA reductase [Burkholderiales bacterium RIFCSPLOWO2_12_FULL_64_99]|jgi:citronellol/citronellal dehydrogenase|uniref:SDR family oxidoreductase n=1 Tax=Aquabacterium sp. TaxID=1872578 RepID=UPI0008C17F6D|nr:SDR family oxidoreductase [Aquabacterium sp.]OGB01915.1 MAG: 2,4-dienoyl-CoA reductase [Burkholderiales bacterium RIFCSPHIGHO2_12_FULL_63_20]OGB66539.1 MAG: 2,4-dienoyl-CoA reductase [Burkholderiales bacterium RIFCSPLOWO2_12_FULL_64_99]